MRDAILLLKGEFMPVQLTNFTSTLWAGLTSGFSSFMNFVPALIGALIILVAGWYIAKLVSKVIERVLVTLKLEKVADTSHINEYLPQTRQGVRPTLSSMIGTIGKWFVFLIFVQAAAIALGVAPLTGIINSVILFIPNIVVAVAILVAGAWAARLVSGIVETNMAKMNIGRPNILALVTKYGIFGFAMIAAISQLGIAVQLINILFTGLVACLALAFGLAFGLGGQSVAGDITRSWLEKGRSAMGPGTVGERSTTDMHDVETPMHH